MAMKRTKRSKDENDIPMSDEFMELVKSSNNNEVVSRDISFSSMGEWSHLPGKKMKRAAELNPLIAVNNGGGIDDASCLEVEVIDASIYMPLTSKKLQASYSSKEPSEQPSTPSEHNTTPPLLEEAKNELVLLKKQRKGGEVSEEDFVSNKTIILKKMEKIRKQMKNLEKVKERDEEAAHAKMAKKKRKSSKKKLVEDPSSLELNGETSTESVTSSTIVPSTPPAWIGFGLHHKLGGALSRAGFVKPTLIQSAVMKAALGNSEQGPRDVMGAAQTGSGKTLAYGLPIIDWLLRRQDMEQDVEDSMKKGDCLQALILCPTRELALQVTNHLTAIIELAIGDKSSSNPDYHRLRKKLGVCTLVGGLSEAKQTRQLEAGPPIVVGTVGRLWELMSSTGACEHLRHMNRIRFLVIDEADRMVQKGSFAELEFILKEITKPIVKSGKAQRSQAFKAALEQSQDKESEEEEEYDDEEEEEEEDEEEDEEEKEEEEEGGEDEAEEEEVSEGAVAPEEASGRELTKSKQSIKKLASLAQSGYMPLDAGEVELVMWPGAGGGVEEEGKVQLPKKKKSKTSFDQFAEMENESSVSSDARFSQEERQSFIFSATLTLEDEDRKLVILNRKQQKMEKKWRGKRKAESSDNALMRIMEKIGIRGEPFIADLTDLSKSQLQLETTTDSSSSAQAPLPSAFKVSLPLGLSLYHAEVVQRSKDAYLYHFLLMQEAQHTVSSFQKRKDMIDAGSGGGDEEGRGLRTIVFVNAIPAVRRLAATLSLLNVHAVAIHAEMQQKQRLKQLDKFKSTDNSKHMVLVATDVAARGLDIPNVNAVVHYDLPRTADAFIHRSGRTARAGTSGTALTLISESQLSSFATMMGSVLGPRFAAKLTLEKGKKQRNNNADEPITSLESSVSEESVDSSNPTHVQPCSFVSDLKLLTRATERATVAGRLVKLEDNAGRNASSTNWYKQQAELMELELDEHIQRDLESQQHINGGAGNDSKEIRRLRISLREMLEQPLNGKRPKDQVRTKRAGSSITNQQPRQKKSKKSSKKRGKK